MKRLLIPLLFLVLASCASTPQVQTVLTPLAPVAVPAISPLVLNPVQFQVMNSQDVQNLATQLKASGADQVYFMLDENDYKNLMLNLNEINSFIGQQTTVVNLLETINQDRANETNAPSTTTKSK